MILTLTHMFVKTNVKKMGKSSKNLTVKRTVMSEDSPKKDMDARNVLNIKGKGSEESSEYETEGMIGCKNPKDLTQNCSSPNKNWLLLLQNINFQIFLICFHYQSTDALWDS